MIGSSARCSAATNNTVATRPMANSTTHVTLRPAVLSLLEPDHQRLPIAIDSVAAPSRSRRALRRGNGSCRLTCATPAAMRPSGTLMKKIHGQLK